MNEQASAIAAILDHLGISGQRSSLLTVGASDIEMPDFATVHAYETLSGPEELPATLSVQLGIVIAPLESMSRTHAEQLLARLRDVHCEKVLLLDTGAGWSPDELRSLGYVEIRRPEDGGRCYLFDPYLFNQPREWNNPSNWANPENFRKYRW